MADTIRMTTVTTKTDQGRALQATVVLGRRHDDTSELRVLGTVAGVPFYGTTVIREGRDEPDGDFHWALTASRMADADASDIIYALFVALDEQPHGIMVQEMDRICG